MAPTRWHGCWRGSLRPCRSRSSSCSTCRRCSPPCSRSGWTGSAGCRSARRSTGEPLVAGEVLVAPGDHHLRLAGLPGSGRVRLDQGPQENFCRPAVDALFRSAGDVFGGRVLAVVLSGMGHDGLAGCRRLAAAGARVLVQDEQTSVVWGMPGAVAGAGLADEVLPLDLVPGRIAAAVARTTPSR
ncbi:CheB methylesterase domain-containing protein [Nocardioides sp. TF02-7]|nr:CheB methylesterase domain-containing protein [Nocardioides sp. TF02-7]UMG92952.1 CheB methylesterase domain-containing protein [Nocardioides sp. TF02-7]